MMTQLNVIFVIFLQPSSGAYVIVEVFVLFPAEIQRTLRHSAAGLHMTEKVLSNVTKCEAKT